MFEMEKKVSYITTQSSFQLKKKKLFAFNTKFNMCSPEFIC